MLYFFLFRYRFRFKCFKRSCLTRQPFCHPRKYGLDLLLWVRVSFTPILDFFPTPIKFFHPTKGVRGKHRTTGAFLSSLVTVTVPCLEVALCSAERDPLYKGFNSVFRFNDFETTGSSRLLCDGKKDPLFT